MGETNSTQGRTALTAAALDPRDRARLHELERTKWLAGGTLVASLAVLVVAKLLERHNPGFGFLAAFAEAATIGGLADWYAVVVRSDGRSACQSRTPRSSFSAARTEYVRRPPAWATRTIAPMCRLPERMSLISSAQPWPVASHPRSLRP
jgi:hypothetical protein